MMFGLKVEMIVMQMIMEMMVNDVFYVISVEVMLLLHVVQHVVSMII